MRSRFSFAKASVTVARETMRVANYPFLSRNLASLCEGEYLGGDFLPRRWKFHKASALRSLPFIYGNPFSNAAGGSETSPDLSRFARIHAGESFCLLTCRFPRSQFD